MELNRNQYFLAGLVIFLLGLQLRMVDAYVLNERSTQFIAQRLQQMKSRQVASAGDLGAIVAHPPGTKHRLRPPKWLGWSLVSVGGVLTLYSLVLKKPGG